MKNNNLQTDFESIICLVVALVVSVLGNIVANQWAVQPDRFLSVWFLGLLIVSPLVYITFGLVVQKVGVSIGSATIDSLTALSTIFVGLFLLGEYDLLNWYQLAGIMLMLLGIGFMQIKKKDEYAK